MDSGAATFRRDDPGFGHRDTVTVFEASRLAGVTQSAIIRWIRNGYLTAAPSPNGWLIAAGELEQAAEAANEARGTGPVPRQTTPSLVPVPTPIRGSVERRATSLNRRDIGDHIVAPLAELIRDQIDVVNDQAEVIGYLQAERTRLAAELELARNRPAGENTPEPEQPEEPAQPARLQDPELYDEVLSLLWKTEPSTETRAVPQERSEPDHDDWGAGELLSDPFNTEQVEPETADPDPVLRIEDYADPSWFFSGTPARNSDEDEERPRPALQPIVPRTGSPRQRSAEPERDPDLHRMIDETERKIADLWRAQEHLRRTAPQPIEYPDRSSSRRMKRLSRLWPIRR